MQRKNHQTIFRIFIFLSVVGITVLLFHYRDEVRRISQYGYLGIFFVSILANATLILPLPGVIFTSAMGAIFSPFWVAVAAGAGASLGELTGYLTGYSGQIVVDRKDWYDRFNRWMSRYGNLTIFILALVPNPLFDLAGMAAGMMSMKIGKFLFWSFLGKFIKMLLFAYTGESIFTYFSGLR